MNLNEMPQAIRDEIAAQTDDLRVAVDVLETANIEDRTLMASLQERITALETAQEEPEVPDEPDVPDLGGGFDWIQGDESRFIDNFMLKANPWGWEGQPAEAYNFASAEALADGGVLVNAVWRVFPTDKNPYVKAFPSVSIGQKPGYDTTDERFPMKVSEAKGKFELEVMNHEVDGMAHLAWDIWLSPEDTRFSNWDSSIINGEILVQSVRWNGYSNPNGDSVGSRDPNRKVAEGVLDGAAVSIYEYPNGTKGSTFWVVVPHDGDIIETLDLEELMMLLADRVPQDSFICNVEAGIEIRSESGVVSFTMVERAVQEQPEEVDPEVYIKALIDQVWAEFDNATPLSQDALAGWIRHFEPHLQDLSEAKIKELMRGFAIADGWVKEEDPVIVVPPVVGDSGSSAAFDPMRAINDMTGDGELVTRSWNYSWQRRAEVMMGSVPHLRNTANWFKKSGFGGNNWWKRLNGWFILFEGVDNPTYNVFIRVSPMVVAIKLHGETGWRYYGPHSVSGAGQAQGGNYFKGHASVATHMEGGDRLVRPTQGADYHGWGEIFDLPDPSRIACVAATSVFTLEGDEADRAQFAATMGGDYHAYVNNAINGTVVPAVAVTRNRHLLPNTPTRVTMVTLRDRGVQDPGGGMSVVEFLADPPQF